MTTNKQNKKPKQKQVNYVDHIILPYNDDTKKLFFTQEVRTTNVIRYNNKQIRESDLAPELLEFLLKGGCEVTAIKKIVDMGRQKVFDINIRVRKSYDKKHQVNGVEITIPSTTYPEFKEKRIIFEDGLKAIIPGVKPEFSTADKYVRC